MDDVGQTLLNWASAFGTQEMVKKHKYKLRVSIRPGFCKHAEQLCACRSRWSFYVRGVQTSTEVKGHPRYTMLRASDGHR